VREADKIAAMKKNPGQNLQESDKELIALINQGSEAAFEDFVTKYESMIFGFGMKVCGNTEDAKDIMQETFLKAFRSIKRLKSADALKTWLYRIATNACLIKRRRGKFEPDKVLSLNELRPSKDEISHSFISGIHMQPDEAMIQKELADTIRRSILSVPSKYRVVLILRDMEGFSAEEAARILNLPISTIKIRLHRARLSFKKYLEKQFRRKKGTRNEKVQRPRKM